MTRKLELEGADTKLPSTLGMMRPDCMIEEAFPRLLASGRASGMAIPICLLLDSLAFVWMKHFQFGGLGDDESSVLKVIERGGVPLWLDFV